MVGAGRRAPMPPRLYLSHDSDLDWLLAPEFGRVNVAEPPDCWRREARRAYRRALALEEVGDQETDAAARLARMAP